MRLVPLLLALCLLFVAHTAVAANIACPESIDETPNVSTEAEGWISVAPTGKRWLEKVAIYYGSIGDLSGQVPYSDKSSKTKETVTWDVGLNKDEGDTNVYWIGCSYLHTSAKFVQKVDAAAKFCVASYDLLPTGSRQRLSTMACR